MPDANSGNVVPPPAKGGKRHERNTDKITQLSGN
jgi:hypothetical protein